jgi:hypothetical protein
MKLVPLIVRFCAELATRSFAGLKLDTVGEGLDEVVLCDPPQPARSRMTAERAVNRRRSDLREQGMGILLAKVPFVALQYQERKRVGKGDTMPNSLLQNWYTPRPG